MQEKHAAELCGLKEVADRSQGQVADLQRSLQAEQASLKELKSRAEQASLQRLQQLQSSADQARTEKEAALAELVRLQEQLAAAGQQAGSMQVSSTVCHPSPDEGRPPA